MTTDEYLENVCYVKNKQTGSLKFYYEKEELGEVSFENSQILDDKDFCIAIMEDYALNHKMFKKLVDE